MSMPRAGRTWCWLVFLVLGCAGGAVDNGPFVILDERQVGEVVRGDAEAPPGVRRCSLLLNGIAAAFDPRCVVAM